MWAQSYKVVELAREKAVTDEMNKLPLLYLTVLLAPALASANGELAAYVASPDPSYEWHEVSSGQIGSTHYSELILTSHTWRGIPWKHQLIIFRPQHVDLAAKQAFLFIHGGRWRPEYESGLGELPRAARIFTRLANTLHAPVAILRQVPFQPLFDRREDALIAYTFDHYLKTGEEDWPLLLPMVKSASRGMDAVQEFAREHWQLQIEKFTVAGASKRGWTSWLTAAVDPRVASVAPMVIDMLNLPAQVALQRETFGELSEEVRDYTEIDLPARIDSDLGRKLLEMVDPWNYRESLTLPKLIVLATNDRYWPLDALKLYWNGLTGPKNVLYVPNQGHGVADIDRLIGSLSALHRYSVRGEPLPSIGWTFNSGEDRVIQLTVETDRRPRRVMAWTATSKSRDFRESRWSARACRKLDATHYQCESRVKPGEHRALYSEVTFTEPDEPPFTLSTAVCIKAGPQDKPNC